LGFTGGKKEPEDATLNKYSLVFSFQELQKATENFSRSKRMGEGGFGAVYRGMQPDGTEIAVKELQNARESGFEDEVRVLSMFRHPNLVVLMGFARNGPKRFLVYELMEGGDLFNRIHKPEAFPWRDRICVAYDAACGLSHLHHQTPKVFHRDIKSPNILLTRSGLAKVADFGLARICKMGGAQRLSDFGGTPGYMCPIYEKTQVITERSEVFSFGVVMLELLTGFNSCWLQRKDPKDKDKTVLWLWKEVTTFRQIEEHPDEKAKWTKRALSEVGQLALKCTHATDEEQRPDFTELVRLLRGMRDLPEKDGYEALSPSSPMKGKQVFEKPLLWFMKVVWVEERQGAFPSTIIEWRAAEKGSPIKIRNMTFGRTDYENVLLPLLSDQLMKCISRKAFEIEVQTLKAQDGKAGQSAWGERIPCSFHIKNLGKNGMAVGPNSTCAALKSSEGMPLRDGDHISLCYCDDPGSENSTWVPFLVFQFLLTDPEDSSSCAVLKDSRGRKVGNGYDAKQGCIKLPVAAVQK